MKFHGIFLIDLIFLIVKATYSISLWLRFGIGIKLHDETSTHDEN